MHKKSSFIVGVFAATLLSAGAHAQMAQTTTRTVDTPAGAATVKNTTRVSDDGTGMVHKTVVRRHDLLGGTHRTVRRCVTHWRHGQRIRSCRTTVHHHW